MRLSEDEYKAFLDGQKAAQEEWDLDYYRQVMGLEPIEPPKPPTTAATKRLAVKGADSAGGKKQSAKSLLEARLRGMLFEAGVPPALEQQTLIDGRKFTVDFFWPEHGLAVEVQGGIWEGDRDDARRGKHLRASGYETDAEKMALLVGLGYRVMYVTTKMMSKGTAVGYIKKALGME